MNKKEPRCGWADYHYDHEARHYQADHCPMCRETSANEKAAKPARS